MGLNKKIISVYESINFGHEDSDLGLYQDLLFRFNYLKSDYHLDAGCGARPIVAPADNGHVTYFDPDKIALESARQNISRMKLLDRARFISGITDVASDKFKSISFALSIHHFKEIESLINSKLFFGRDVSDKEFIEILASSLRKYSEMLLDDGSFFIYDYRVPFDLDYSSQPSQPEEEEIKSFAYGREHFYAYHNVLKQEYYLKALERLGFSIIRHKTSPRLFWIQAVK